MSSSKKQPRFERWKLAVLDHRWLAAILFLGATVIAIGAFSDALLKIGDLFKRDENKATTAPKPGTVSIDAVTKVSQNSPDSETSRLAFDITIRNTTNSPAAITEARFDFNEHLAGVLNSVQEVSGVYFVSVDDSGVAVKGPVGRMDAYAWYPTPDGRKLIVKSPLSQTVAPNSVDRFRIVFSGGGLRGPLERVTVRLTYNGSETVVAEGVTLK